MIGTEEALPKALRTKRGKDRRGSSLRVSEPAWAWAGGWLLGALCLGKPPSVGCGEVATEGCLCCGDWGRQLLVTGVTLNC